MLSYQQKFWNIYARLVQKPALAMLRHVPTSRFVADLNAVTTLKTPKDLKLFDHELRRGQQSVQTTICRTGPTPTGGSMLYLHGGGFVLGSLRSYRHLVAQLGLAANQRALFLNYGLAPENVFPVALDQTTTAYEALCNDPDAGRISIVGDSAGGNLAFALLHRICSRDLPQPTAVIGISPLTDLRKTDGSRQTNMRSDHLLPLKWTQRGQAAYLNGHASNDPEVSPVLGSYAGAPPCLIHVDETEILFDDATALADRLRDEGVVTKLVVSKGRSHVWHLNVGRCPEADASVAEIGLFIREVNP